MNNRRQIAVTLFFLTLSYLLIADFVEWISPETNNDESQQELFSFASTFARDLGEKSGHKVKNEDTFFKSTFEKFDAGNELLDEVRQACLPRFVCELFANGDKDKLTDSEKSLMSLIMDTSLSTRPSTISQYHFAAHMGQLLLDVDGNNCQNFYPSCPLAANEALALSRKLKIR